MQTDEKPAGPDLTLGIALADVPAGGAIAAHVGDTPVLLSRSGDELHAVTAACTHYGGPLSEGLVADGTVRCPWHHACFSLRTGEALAAPAFDPLQLWRVEVTDGKAFVREQLTSEPSKAKTQRHETPQRIVVVGGGAAGFAAAEMLRRKGYDGALTMLSADAFLPCDRPNLSKDYLAGNAPEEWLFVKDEAFYRDKAITVRLETTAAAIETASREVRTSAGEVFGYDRLLLATGADPVRPHVPGFMRDNVFTLRTVGDARAIIEAATHAKTAAIAGASFIGLEVAASLRARGLEVHVIAPERVPMERILGREIGEEVRTIHQGHGVRFHLGRSVENFDGRRVLLSDGGELAAEILILGIGVRPSVALARQAGLEVTNGVPVDAMLQTRVPGIFAAGDIALYPDPISGESLRVEHWVAAERQGQLAAANMLGENQPYRSVPFFWSNHYDLAIRYVGSSAKWDRMEMDGSAASGSCTARYFRGSRLLAAASIGRDKENLEIERALEQQIANAGETVLS